MRRLASIIATLALGATVLATSATGDDSHTYYIELDNAFGITNGSEVKVAGVVTGTVTELDINAAKRALLTIELAGDLSQLGEDTICSSEPQSLIAEYSIDCQPKGPPLEDGATIPVTQTRQTVQNDLVQSGLREPYKRRLQLILNEFGTSIAGNAESLNQAIRRGAPALRETRQVLAILGDQNTLLRDLNVDSDAIFQRLAEQRTEITRFITESADISQATAERGEDLSADFRQLDDFVAELEPTLVELGNVTAEQTPLLRDLRASAAGLDTLATNLPAFNTATGRSAGRPWQRRRARRTRFPQGRQRDRGAPPLDQERLPGRRRSAQVLRGHRRSEPRRRDRRPRGRGHGPQVADRLHRPRGPAQLRLLPDRRDQPVRQRRPPAALLALRRREPPLQRLRHRRRARDA